MEKGDPEAPGSDTTVVESTFCGYVNVNVFLYSQLGAGKFKLELIAFHPQKVLIRLNIFNSFFYLSRQTQYTLNLHNFKKKVIYTNI